MSFRILHLEDNEMFARRVEEAVSDSNHDGGRRPLEICTIYDPSELAEALEDNYDLLLADLHFKDANGEEENRLDDILSITKQWSERHRLEKQFPVIVYTLRELKGLNQALDHKDELFDIWDKTSASPAYAAWRLSCIATEISRTLPDSTLVRLIRKMDGGAEWHAQVQDMALRYSNAWTELDQIERVGEPISKIGHTLDAGNNLFDDYWSVMQEWEALGRSVAHHTRGHARHVTNVFWMGYFLLHHDLLSGLFDEWWQSIKMDRGEMSPVQNVSSKEALSAAWYYAGLFHDVANCIQKNRSVSGAYHSITNAFDGLIKHGVVETTFDDDLVRQGDELLSKFNDDVSSVFKPLWRQSVDDGKPDHGVFSGIHLTNSIRDAKQSCFAREAARAMSIHNMIGDLSDSNASLFSWQKEPIVCLLLLCDQLQTWDRERGDDRLNGPDGPVRAELLAFDVSEVQGRPNVTIEIEYIAPRHLDHAPDIYSRVKDSLERVLRQRPDATLRRIQQPWPFSLSVKFWLSGELLDASTKFE